MGPHNNEDYKICGVCNIRVPLFLELLGSPIGLALHCWPCFVSVSEPPASMTSSADLPPPEPVWGSPARSMLCGSVDMR